VQESLIFTMVLDLFLLQFVLGRGYNLDWLEYGLHNDQSATFTSRIDFVIHMLVF